MFPRRLSPLVVVAFLAVVFTAAGYAQQPHIAREGIEWCNIWIPDANGTKLPRVLLIGDSITGGYGPKVAETSPWTISTAW